MARKGLARSRPNRSLVFPGTSGAHFRRNISRVDMLCMRWEHSKVCVSERPSQPTAAGTTAVAPSGVDSSVAASPRGRHRVPSSPRGRPSGSPGLSSPLRPAASSSPSKRASGSPARRRGSPVTSSPRVEKHARESQVRVYGKSTARFVFVFREWALLHSKSCLYKISRKC